MRILQICKKFPYPLKDGESIAVTYLAKALHQLGSKITLLALNTSKHHININQLPKNFNHYEAIHTVNIDNRIRPIGALKALLQGKNYMLSRYESAKFEEKLMQLLQQEKFDILHFETLQAAIFYRPILKKQTLVALRAHNVEHEIWERILSNTTFLPKKWYLKQLTRQLKQFEIATIREIDTLIAITQRDMQQFQQLGFQQNGHITPIGLEVSNYDVDYDSYQEPLSLGFIGSLDWMPNLEGIQWFLKEVMPSLCLKFPTLKLHLAGRNTPDWLLRQDINNVVIHGEVENAHTFIRQHSIMIVPLFSGSGMRVKILEGMALGRVILTTTIGVEGIDMQNGASGWIADSKAAFLQRIQYCVNHPKRLVEMGQKARIFMEQNYDNVVIGRRLLEHYRQLKNVK